MSEPTQTPDQLAEQRLDQVFLETGLGANHGLLLDWARIKFVLKDHAAAIARVQEIAAEERSCCPDGVGFREYIGRLKARVGVLEEALNGILERYVGLVNCGDCGNWNPEQETVVIRARQALSPQEG